MKTEQKRHKIKFFINFFEALPDEKWCIGSVTNALGQHCALGHALAFDQQQNPSRPVGLGMGYGLAWSLQLLLPNVTQHNDGICTKRLKTPKKRVLAVLHEKLKECL